MIPNLFATALEISILNLQFKDEVVMLDLKMFFFFSVKSALWIENLNGLHSFV